MAKNNATDAKPSGTVQNTADNTPRHKLIAMGQQPKDVGGSGSKPGK